MAALVRARGLGGGAASAPAGTLAARLGAQRDGQGGYGSVQATRFVVRALLESAGADPAPGPATVTVRWTELGEGGRAGPSGQREVGRGGSIVVPLGAAVTAVRVQTPARDIVARLERPMLRSFGRVFLGSSDQT